MFLNKNIFCDPSLELFRRDGSKEGSQHMFSLRNKKKLSLNYPQYSLLSVALLELFKNSCSRFLQCVFIINQTTSCSCIKLTHVHATYTEI